MGIIDKITSSLLNRAVEKYSDEWPEKTIWIALAVLAFVMAVLSSTSKPDFLTWPSERDQADVVLAELSDADLTAELDRRTAEKAG